MEPLARLEGLGVRLGATPVLRDVAVELKTAEVVGLMGPNGSGKTTLLRVLATLVPPTHGWGQVLGADLHSTERFRVRGQIGLIGHTPALYPELTLEENTSLVAGLSGVPGVRVGKALEAVGLTGASGRRADHCSYGMLRRAEFARVLLTRPRLLLMDEAHAGLDRSALGLVDFLLSETRQRGGAAVVVSHDPDRVLPYADRVLELRGGRLGKPEAMAHRSGALLPEVRK